MPAGDHAELGDRNSLHAGEDAADCVRYLCGVTGVSNQIAIKPSVSGTVVKPDIAAALKRRATSDAKSISVDAKGADLTLTGTVHSWAERDLATRSAWGRAGVRSVVDNPSLVLKAWTPTRVADRCRSRPARQPEPVVSVGHR